LIYQYQIHLICYLAPGIHRHQGTHPHRWNLCSQLEAKIEEEDGIEGRKEGEAGVEKGEE
jgi:hypothetical protein